MILIQFILILFLLGIILVYFSLLRSRVFDKVIVLVIPLTGFIFILKPNWLTRVAHVVGIGRGTDLLIYIGVLFFLFVILFFYAKIYRMERKITKMVRKDAIDNAKKLQESTND